MSELLQRHELTDDAFHEIQLSGKQLVFLFMATTIVAVVIFLCGVQVGRGVKIERSAEPETVAAAVPAPAERPTSAPAAVPTEPPPAEPPVPAKETADDLSYAKRLSSETAPNDKVKPRPDGGAAAPEAKAPPARTPAPVKEAPARTTAAAAAPTSGRPGVWVVQVHALKDQGAAAALAQRLSAKGYPAFVLNPTAGAPAIYRVQVGRYNDRHEAEQVARRLEKEEQFKPWISH
jgi:hypothetical protein